MFSEWNMINQIETNNQLSSYWCTHILLNNFQMHSLHNITFIAYAFALNKEIDLKRIFTFCKLKKPGLQ